MDSFQRTTPGKPLIPEKLLPKYPMRGGGQPPRPPSVADHRPLPPDTIAPVIAAAFRFRDEQPFHPETARETLRHVPEAPGICALFGPDPSAQPYLTRTANLRRRLARLLDPPDGLSKRLNLRDRVARIAWTETGSEFESLLALYNATSSLFNPAEARRRLRLHTPTFVRLTTEHAHPRLYTTNRLSRSGLAQLYGPFPSRLAAERYLDAVLDLFRLRRCHEDLQVHPDHPGCVYGEMKRCMSPCNTACSAEDYSAEARAVRAFLDTHGESLLASIAAERQHASEAMDFERAADLHTRWEKIKATAALADPLVRPIPELRALIAQRAAPRIVVQTPHDQAPHDESPHDQTPHDQTPHDQPSQRQADPAPHAELASVFLLRAGRLLGPEPLSTLGVRAVREQTSVGSSLFAQPLMLHAVPLGTPSSQAPPVPDQSPETRAEAVLATLESAPVDLDPATLSDHLSLLRRWYYRPEKQRGGEVLLPDPEGSWPARKLLRAAARAVLGDPGSMQPTDREAAKNIKTLKTKTLHAGRPDVERVVPDLAPITSSAAILGRTPPVYRSRRSPREQRP